MVTYDKTDSVCVNPMTGEAETLISVANVSVNGVLAHKGFSFPAGMSDVLVRNSVERALGEAETDATHADVLSSLKAEMVEKLRVECRDFVYLHYSAERQQTFALLRSEARLDGMINRANYVGQVIGWIDAAFSYFYAKAAEILGAADRAALDAVTWDFSVLSAADPVVTIYDARAITS
jgi:hypothetical protein